MGELKGLSGKQYDEFLESVGLTPPKKDNIITEAAQGLGAGLTQGAKGFASTLDEMGVKTPLAMVKNFERTHQHWNPDPEYKALSLDPVNVARTITHGVGTSLATIGAGIATTAVTANPLAGAGVTFASSAAQIYGEEAKEFRRIMPNQDETVTNGLAFLSTIAQAAIETGTGPQKLAPKLVQDLARGALKNTTKHLGKRIFTEAIKSGLEEGGEEVLQLYTSYLFKKMGDANIDIPGGEEALENFMGGFLSGGFMGGVMGSIHNKPDTEETGGGIDNVVLDTPNDFNEKTVQQLSKHWDIDETTPDIVQGLQGAGFNGDDIQILKPKSRAAKAMSELGQELTGDAPIFFSPLTDQASIANGFIDSNNRLYIDAFSAEQNPLVTMGHEFGHYMSRTSQQDYTQFQNILFKNLQKNHREYLDGIIDTYQKHGKQIDDTAVAREFTNDVLGDMFADATFWQEVFAEPDQSGFKVKLASTVMRFIDAIKEKLKGLTGAAKHIKELDKVRSAAVQLIKSQKGVKDEYITPVKEVSPKQEERQKALEEIKQKHANTEQFLKDNGYKILKIMPRSEKEEARYRQKGYSPVLLEKDGLKNNILGIWAKEATQTQAKQEEPPKNTAPADQENTSNTLESSLREIINNPHPMRIKNSQIKRIAKQHDITEKEAQETIETILVEDAEKIARSDMPRREKFNALLSLYNSQPILGKRTSTSIANQAYSTPAPLAFLCGELIDIQSGTRIYEPTAGNGMLLIGANPNNVWANELDDSRREALKKRGYRRVTGHDALKSGPGKKTANRIIMNPPFDKLDNVTDYDGYKISKLDHAIVIKSLEGLSEDGRAAIIVGAQRAPGKISAADKVFMNYLYNNFNVTGNFEVDGSLYNKQGASFPLRIISLNGRRDNNGVIEKLAPQSVDRLEDWNYIYNTVQEIINADNRNQSRPASVVADNGRSGDRTGSDTKRSTAADASGMGRRSGRNNNDASAERNTRRDQRKQEPTEQGLPGQLSEPDGKRPGTDVNRTDNASRREQSQGKPVADANLVQDESQDKNQRQGTEERNSENGRLQQPSELSRTSNRVSVSDYQDQYTPSSSSKELGTVVPKFMTKASQKALSALQSSVGNIDEYVASKLGYSSVDELHNGLAAEQVDGVALAISQIEKGSAAIIGDQTGIGKGRQAAAIIRYAKRNGMLPIFITIDPKLYSDMYFDGKDIGSEFKPFLIGDSQKSHVRGSEGDIIQRALSGAAQKAQFNDILENGLGDYDSIFLTYSQINKPNRQQAFLSALSNINDVLLIMDESHNAGGDSTTGLYLRGGIKPPAKKGMSPITFPGLLNSAKGAVYLSATYAKRPDNMPLYFKTNLSKAVEDISKLPEVITQGGLPLQQIIAKELANDGQYIRRERDFTGVKFDMIRHEDNKEKVIKQFDNVTSGLEQITTFSRMMREVVKNIEDASATGRAGQRTEVQNFSSIVHNYIGQLLVATKADAAITRAVEAHKNGQKIVIGVMNTMGSFIEETAKDMNIQPGEELDLSFRDLLHRALDRQLRVSKKDGGGNSSVEIINPASLGLDGAFIRAKDYINNLNINLPVSPIDYILNELNRRGISTGEITGRKYTLDYRDGKTFLKLRGEKEIKDKNRWVNGFNNGDYDALIINQSGSTGLSIHASEKFKDQRQRKMILLQPHLDINIVLQMFGRVLRSGQVVKPEYEILATPLQAERRPLNVLTTKMKSLNANTTADSDSAMTLEGVDLLNKYGDVAAADFLNDNPHIMTRLDLSTETSQDGNVSPQENLARRLTGRMAILPDRQQGAILNELESRYTAYINELKAIGLYDLEVMNYDNWDAETVSEDKLADGKSGEGVFNAPVVMKTIKHKEVLKPPTFEQVMSQRNEEWKTKESTTKFFDNLIQQLDDEFEKFSKHLEEDRQYQLGIQKTKTLQTLRYIERMIGRAVDVSSSDIDYTGIITDISLKKAKGNPVAASRINIRLMVADSIRKLDVSLSSIINDRIKLISNYDNAKVIFDRAGNASGYVNRKVITGNLLKGLEFAERGKIISWNNKDGSEETGILLPKSWSEKNLIRDPRRELKNGVAAIKYIDKFNEALFTVDGVLGIYPSQGKIMFTTPRARSRGGKYFLNDDLLSVTGDFHSTANRMAVTVDKDVAARAADIIIKQIEPVIARDATPEQIKEAHTEYSLKKVHLPKVPDDMPEFGGDLKIIRNWLKEYYSKIKHPVVKINGEATTIGIHAKGLKETLNHIQRNKEVAILHYKTLPFIHTLLANATHTKDLPSTKKDVKLVHKLNTLIDIDGKEYNVELTVFQYMKDNRNYYDHKLTKFETLPPPLGAGDNTAFPIGSRKVSKDNNTSQEDKSQEFSLKKQANPGITPEVRELNKRIQENHKPDKVTHSSLDQAAENTIRQMGAKNLLESMTKGHFLLDNDENIRIALKLLNHQEMLDMMRKGDTTASNAMEQWVKQGTEAGRTLAARKSNEAYGAEGIHGILKGLLYAPSSKYRREADNERRKELLKTYEKELINKALAAIKNNVGVDFFKMTEDQLNNEKLRSQIAREIQIAKSSFGDKAYEWWINSLLSMPRTQAANIVGNTAMATVELLPQRFIEASINAVLNNKKGATFGEFRDMWDAFKENIKPALKNAIKAFDLETPVTDNVSKLESPRTAIGGQAGRVIRLPGRFLLAADELAKSIIIPVEATAYAHRQAKAEGLNGEAMKKRMNELLSKPYGAAKRWAKGRAEELTFQQDPGRMVKLLMLAKDSPGATGTILRYLLPFMRTPANIMATTVRKSPLGTLGLAWSSLVTGRVTIKDERFIRLAAEQVIAWSLAMWLASSLDGDDDDLPMMTGSKGNYQGSDYRWKQRNLPSTSIRIGEQWYDYSRIEPFGNILAMMVDAVDSYKMAQNGAEGSKVARKVINSITHNIRDKTFLQSVGDVIRAMEDGSYGTTMVTNFVSSWIPNIYRGTINAMEDNLPDNKSYARGMDWFKEQFSVKAAGRAGFVVNAPKVDIWGNDIEKQNIGNMVPPFVWRITSPIRTRQIDMSKPDQLLWNYNRMNPNDEYWPQNPAPYYKVSGKTVFIKGVLYRKYAKYAGEIARKEVERRIASGVLNIDNPGKKDIEQVKSIFRKARKTAKKRILK